MGTITKNYTFTDGNVTDADEVNANFDTLYTWANGNVDSANISDNAVRDTEMHTAVSVVTRFKENFQGHVVATTDFAVTTATNALTATCATGTAYVNGVRVTPSATSSHACATSTDTFIDIDDTGTYSWNNSATCATNAIRLWKLTMTTGGCSATVDMRNFEAVNASNVEQGVVGVSATRNVTTTAATNTSTTFTTLVDGGTVDVKSGDYLILNGQALVNANATLTVTAAFSVGTATTDMYVQGAFGATTSRLAIHDVYAVAADSATLPVSFMWKVSDSSSTASALSRIISVQQIRPTG
jgi:hypothetical protein